MRFFVVNICILQPSCLPASPPICAELSARTPSPPMTADTCVQLPCACFQLPHAKFNANAKNISQPDRARVHQPEFVRKCKRFSIRSMLRTTAPCANLQQPRRNGRSPGRSAAALPSKHPKGRADAERQCRITSILLLRNSFPEERARPVLPDPLGPELSDI